MAASNRAAQEDNTLAQDKYPVVEFVQATITYNSQIDIKKLLSAYDLPYIKTGRKIHADENDNAPYDIDYTVIIGRNDLEKLRNKAEIGKIQIEKVVKMAVIDLLETDASDKQYDFSSPLKAYFKDNFPYVVMDPNQRYYKYDTVAAHRGHPCEYRMYVPVNLIAKVEQIIRELKYITCIPKCLEFKLSLADDDSTSRLVRQIKQFDQRIRIRTEYDKSVEYIYCKIPIDLALGLCTTFFLYGIKTLACIDDPGIVEKAKTNADFIRTILDENEIEALKLLDAGKITPNECPFHSLHGSKTDPSQPLFGAAGNGMIKLTTALLQPEFGVDVDKTGEDGNTPLLEACYSSPADKLLPILQVLINANANINHRNTKNENALDLIIKKLKKGINRSQEEDYRQVVSFLRDHKIEETAGQQQDIDSFFPCVALRAGN